MNIDELLDLMEETMEEASGLPFSGSKRMVDIDKMRDIIDEVRLNMPTEIRQAKAIVNDRADIIASAKREAEAIVKKAEDREEQELNMYLIDIARKLTASLNTKVLIKQGARGTGRIEIDYYSTSLFVEPAGPQRGGGQDRARQPAPEREEQ